MDRRQFPSLQVDASHGSTTRTLPDPVLAIPLRDGRNLDYFLLLGPKQSGDVYTKTDLASMASVAERASSQLRALRDHRAIELERMRGDELRALKEAAEHAYESRSRFLAAASHDLRQPLHALGLFGESLAASSRDGKVDVDLVERIRRSTASLEEMFDSLLDVSRLDVGSVEAHAEPLSIEPLLSQIAEQIEPVAQHKRLTLELESGNETVVSDRVLLGRIVRNLATNAVRYTARGEVSLSSRREGDDVVIAVRDTGPGIPPARQADIFDEFVQLDPGAGEGLGLGLSIVSRLARLLGHTIAVESTPGSGSTFTVRVPVADAAAEAPASPMTPMGIDLAGCRVLVIDDDLQILEGMGRMLRGWGCRVTLAACIDDVEESLSVAELPDVVLADLRLRGGETGVEAIETVRRMVGSEIPAALISGESIASAPIGLRMVRKPVPPVRLRALLTELFGEAKAARG
jgi:signal transduction histidine kinase